MIPYFPTFQEALDVMVNIAPNYGFEELSIVQLDNKYLITDKCFQYFYHLKGREENFDKHSDDLPFQDSLINIDSRSLVVTNNIIQVKKKLQENNLSINFNRLNFQKDYIKINCWDGKRKTHYKEIRDIAVSIQRELGCIILFKPYCDKFESLDLDTTYLPHNTNFFDVYLFPSKKSNGYFLELNLTVKDFKEILNKIKNFINGLRISINQSQDEEHFLKCLGASLQWEDFLLPHHTGIAFTPGTYSSFWKGSIEKIPSIIQYNPLSDQIDFNSISPINSLSSYNHNYLYFTAENGETEKWMEKVESTVFDLEKTDPNSLPYDDYSHDSNHTQWRKPSDSPYYNDSLDMDQQSSEFWDDL